MVKYFQAKGSKPKQKRKGGSKMYVLTNGKNDIIGWDLETGEHGVFTHTAQQAFFQAEKEAWDYMDLLERLGINVRNMTVKEL